MYKYTDEKKKHLHTYKGEPLYGTSTVVGILNKPLTWWAAGMAVGTLGWTATQSDKDMRLEVATIAFEEIKSLSAEEYLKRLDLAYKAHNEKKKDSAVTGTDMHAELEKYVKLMITDQGGKPMYMNGYEHTAVERFAKWAVLNVEKFVFSEGHTYSVTHWVGGIVDVGAIMKGGKFALLDFKSSKEVYYSQLVQIGGYAIQVEETGVCDDNGNQIMPPTKVDEIIVIPFGSEDINTRSAQNVEAFKSAFIGCLENYKLNQAFEDYSKKTIKI